MSEHPQGFEPLTVRLEHIPGSRLAILLHDLRYWDRQGRCTLVPNGFPTDGGTKPRWVWMWLGHPYKSCWLAAYVIHDWWCDQAREMAAIDRPEAVKIRLEGDLLFNECLAFLGANRASRRAHWIGVRAGAWASGLGR